MIAMGDYLGGLGNGDAWYCPIDAELTNHVYYQTYNKQLLASIDANVLKSLIGSMPATAESAPILNYLRWVLSLVVSIA